MKIKKSTRLLSTILFVSINCICTHTVTAATELTIESSPVEAPPTNYAQNPEAIKKITEIAARHQFDEKYLVSLLMALHKDDDVLAKMSRPAEKTKPWFEYAKIFSDQARLDNGVAFYQDNKKWFDKAYATYGVDPFIITGIIGVETRYGKVTGNTPVLQALATLCFDYPKRSEFFCSEFEHFLQLARRENWNPLPVHGSYAGAMGMTQFMPSSYLNDAIDFDGDGNVDLWQSTADAIGSIANYLKNRGWEKDGEIYYKLPEKPTLSTFGDSHKPNVQISQYKDDEKLKNDKKFIKWLEKEKAQTVGSLILQEETGDAYFLTHNNFFVITRYNTSPMYAMAVTNLAANIKHQLNQESPND